MDLIRLRTCAQLRHEPGFFFSSSFPVTFSVFYKIKANLSPIWNPAVEPGPMVEVPAGNLL